MPNRSIPRALRPTLQTYRAFIWAPNTARVVEATAENLISGISPDAPYAFATLDLGSLDPKPPPGVGTIRIAVFYPDGETRVERHPNSLQVLYSVRGKGETRVEHDGVWQTDTFGGDIDERLEDRWHVVEPGQWHQSIARGNEPWVLVTFHSARDVEDEYRD